MVNVKAVNLAEKRQYCINAQPLVENETSPTQDMESRDSSGTQSLVVCLSGLTSKDFTVGYRKIRCATGAKLRLCNGVTPKSCNACI